MTPSRQGIEERSSTELPNNVFFGNPLTKVEHIDNY
jgi:hypothetical protein